MEIHCRVHLVSPAIYSFVYSFLKAILATEVTEITEGGGLVFYAL